MKTNDKNLHKLNKKGAGASKTKKQASAIFAGNAQENGEIFKRGFSLLNNGFLDRLSLQLFVPFYLFFRKVCRE